MTLIACGMRIDGNNDAIVLSMKQALHPVFAHLRHAGGVQCSPHCGILAMLHNKLQEE